MNEFRRALVSAVLAMTFLLSHPAASTATEEDGAEIAAPQPARGPVTDLPLPRFVSMKGSEGRARRGPGRTYKIDWLFTQRGIPLEITAEYGHWRRVRDLDGLGGWMHYALLSGVRTAVIVADKVALRVSPSEEAAVRAFALKGVIVRLGKCNPDWCRVSVDQHKGWTEKTGLWGVRADEIRE